MVRDFKVGDVVEPNWYPGDKAKVIAVGLDRFGGRLEQIITIRSDGMRVTMRAAHFDLVASESDQ